MTLAGSDLDLDPVGLELAVVEAGAVFEEFDDPFAGLFAPHERGDVGPKSFPAAADEAARRLVRADPAGHEELAAALGLLVRCAVRGNALARMLLELRAFDVVAETEADRGFLQTVGEDAAAFAALAARLNGGPSSGNRTAAGPEAAMRTSELLMVAGRYRDGLGLVSRF